MQGMYMCLTLLILYNRSTSGDSERPDAQPESSSVMPSYPCAQVQVVREVFCLHAMLILLSPTCGYNFLINVVTILSQHCHVMHVEQNENIGSTCSVKHVFIRGNPLPNKETQDFQWSMAISIILDFKCKQ